MQENQAECGYSEDLNPFLVGTMAAERRKVFVEHLDSCASCQATIEALREDERLTLAPLTVEEQRQFQQIVESVRQHFRQHLEWDRRVRQSEELFATPTFSVWQSPQARRALLFALLFAMLAALVLWWWWGRG